MTNATPSNPERKPDCVTEVRIGRTILTVSGYFKQDTTDTAADKMAKVLEAESRCQISPGLCYTVAIGIAGPGLSDWRKRC